MKSNLKSQTQRREWHTTSCFSEPVFIVVEALSWSHGLSGLDVSWCNNVYHFLVKYLLTQPERCWSSQALSKKQSRNVTPIVRFQQGSWDLTRISEHNNVTCVFVWFYNYVDILHSNESVVSESKGRFVSKTLLPSRFLCSMTGMNLEIMAWWTKVTGHHWAKIHLIHLPMAWWHFIEMPLFTCLNDSQRCLKTFGVYHSSHLATKTFSFFGLESRACAALIRTFSAGMRLRQRHPRRLWGPAKWSTHQFDRPSTSWCFNKSMKDHEKNQLLRQRFLRSGLPDHVISDFDLQLAALFLVRQTSLKHCKTLTDW